jgi:hypothetical protein
VLVLYQKVFGNHFLLAIWIDSEPERLCACDFICRRMLSMIAILAHKGKEKAADWLFRSIKLLHGSRMILWSNSLLPTCSPLQSGFCAATSATTPAATGAAMDVPVA